MNKERPSGAIHLGGLAHRIPTTCLMYLLSSMFKTSPQAFINSPAVAAALDGGPTAGPWRLAALLAAHTVPGRALLKAQLIGGIVLVSAAGTELRVRRTRWGGTCVEVVSGKVGAAWVAERCGWRGFVDFEQGWREQRRSGWLLWGAPWASAVRRTLLHSLPRQRGVMRSVAGCFVLPTGEIYCICASMRRTSVAALQE